MKRLGAPAWAFIWAASLGIAPFFPEQPLAGLAVGFWLFGAFALHTVKRLPLGCVGTAGALVATRIVVQSVAPFPIIAWLSITLIAGGMSLAALAVNLVGFLAAVHLYHLPWATLPAFLVAVVAGGWLRHRDPQSKLMALGSYWAHLVSLGVLGVILILLLSMFQ